jgi:hypothetical protein
LLHHLGRNTNRLVLAQTRYFIDEFNDKGKLDVLCVRDSQLDHEVAQASRQRIHLPRDGAYAARVIIHELSNRVQKRQYFRLLQVHAVVESGLRQFFNQVIQAARFRQALEAADLLQKGNLSFYRHVLDVFLGGNVVHDGGDA